MTAALLVAPTISAANAQPLGGSNNAPELPRIDIVEGKKGIYATGIIVSGGMLAKPLPLLPFRAGHVKHALALSADRIVAAGDDGKVALIALPRGTVVATFDGRREQRDRDWSQLLPTRDGRHLVLVAENRLIVLDTATLAVVRDWSIIEHKSGVWQSVTLELNDPRRRGLATVDRPDLDLLEISGAVRELRDGRLMAALGTNVYNQAPTRHGYYRFDIATGEIERQVAFRGPRDLLIGGWGDFFAFSPSGRYALRRHYDAVPLGVMPGGMRTTVVNPGTHAEHPDVKADGVNRFGMVVELWDLAGEPRLVDKIVTRMIAFNHVASGPLGIMLSENELLDVAANTDLARSKPFVQTYPNWVAHERSFDEARAQLKSRQTAEFDRLAKELGLQSSLTQSGSQPRLYGDDAAFNALDKSAQNQLIRLASKFFGELADLEGRAKSKKEIAKQLQLFPNTIAQAFWDDDETGFWLRYSPHVLRRVGIDGSLSPLVAFERLSKRNDPLAYAWHTGGTELVRSVLRDQSGRFHFAIENAISYSNNKHEIALISWDPASIRGAAGETVVVRRTDDNFIKNAQQPPPAELFEAFLRDSASVKVTLAGDTEADAIAAINVLKTQFEGGIELLKYDNLIHVEFKLGGRTIGEKAFFDGLVDRNWRATVPALRQLMLAYLDRIQGGDGDTPWHVDSAIRALACLDPDQRDVYRTYLKKRDGRHSYPAIELYKEFIARHDYRHADDLRFGAFVALNTLWSGISPDVAVWGWAGLLDAGAQLVTPSQFAALLAEELMAFASVEGRWDFQAGEYYRDTLLKALDSRGPFQKDTAKALRELLPSRN